MMCKKYYYTKILVLTKIIKLKSHLISDNYKIKLIAYIIVSGYIMKNKSSFTLVQLVGRYGQFRGRSLP